jgi:hypothetical protein
LSKQLTVNFFFTCAASYALSNMTMIILHLNMTDYFTSNRCLVVSELVEDCRKCCTEDSDDSISKVPNMNGSKSKLFYL